MKTVAIVQARMTSTRLPGKVLASFNGEPMLAYMLRRVRRSRRLDALVVATTVNRSDDPIAELGTERGIPIFRGEEQDVLGRFVGASRQFAADAVVRLTADCPLIDPEVVDDAIDLFASGAFDYVSNAMERTFPDGLDVEVFTRSALNKADREAKLPFHREHVTPYLRAGLYQDVPTGPFKVGHLCAPADFSHLRWTVDTAEDLQRARAIAEWLPEEHGWLDVVSLLTRQPGLLGSAEELCRAADRTARLVVRPATADDGDLLFDWVNSQDSLAGKLRTTRPISHESHAAWFAARLADGDCDIWIAEDSGRPVGQVRLERRDGGLEVDIYVVAAARGQGFGATMLERARAKAARRWPGTPLLARIKADNWASRRLFAKAGYGRMTVAPGHVVLHRDPLPPERVPQGSAP